jgi:hypothetical protein
MDFHSQELFFGLPTTIDGKMQLHEDVVRMLDLDTLEYSNALGVDGSSNFSAGTFGQLLTVHLKVEVGFGYFE